MCQQGQGGGGDKLEPWNYSFSCWEEKESSVSLADIPLNLIHYCVVTLLSPRAANWASCGALKYPDGGQDSQHSIREEKKKKKGPNWWSFFSQPKFNTISHCICEPVVGANCENKFQSNQSKARGVYKGLNPASSADDAVQYIMG